MPCSCVCYVLSTLVITSLGCMRSILLSRHLQPDVCNSCISRFVWALWGRAVLTKNAVLSTIIVVPLAKINSEIFTSGALLVASRKHAYIILTPFNPILYRKTGVYRGIHYFSYICSKHRLWVLVRGAEAVLTSTHNLFFEQKYEKYKSFLSENFQFLEVKYSIYLNRRVFVMGTITFI